MLILGVAIYLIVAAVVMVWLGYTAPKELTLLMALKAAVEGVLWLPLLFVLLILALPTVGQRIAHKRLDKQMKQSYTGRQEAAERERGNTV